MQQPGDQQESAAPEAEPSARQPVPITDPETDTEPAPPPSFEEHFATLQKEAAELKDAWMRAKAEADNIRKRADERIAAAHKFAVESFANELLSVRDSLEAALAVEQATLESYRSGVELTLKQLTAAFSKSRLSEIDPLGEKFDPHRHQAIAMVEADQDSNSVVAVMQKGYSLNDRVLRPALVTVAKPKPAA